MQIDVKRIGSEAAGLWKRMKPLQRAILVAVLLLAIGGMVVLAATAGRSESEYGVLFSGLTEEDAASVVESLKAEKVPHRIEGNGATISVPRERVSELRLSLASKGVPRGGGVGFELFDKQTFGTTTFVEEMNYRRALAGELSRTISSLDPIERARVHIAMPERSLYKKLDQEPAVSVAVRLRPGRSLSKSQLKGIVHLVSSSVAKLKPDRVTVVDESGSVLWSGAENGEVGTRQREIERTLRDRIREIMDRIVGPGQSVVVVTATMDGSQKERTEELFDKESAVLRSQSRTEQIRYSSTESGGLTGVKANLPASAEPIATKTDQRAPKDSKISETKNYEVNRILNRVTEEPIKVKRLHVAILINGALESSTSTLAGGDLAVRRLPINTQRIAALAREAAGLDLERGDRLEVHSIPFAGTTPIDENPSGPAAKASMPAEIERWQLAAGAAALLLFLAVSIALPLRMRRKRRIELERAEKALLAEGAVSIEPPKSTRERVREAVRQDADRAARILSAWLREGEEIG